jgi:hypothetical protein
MPMHDTRLECQKSVAEELSLLGQCTVSYGKHPDAPKAPRFFEKSETNSSTTRRSISEDLNFQIQEEFLGSGHDCFHPHRLEFNIH